MKKKSCFLIIQFRWHIDEYFDQQLFPMYSHQKITWLKISKKTIKLVKKTILTFWYLNNLRLSAAEKKPISYTKVKNKLTAATTDTSPLHISKIKCTMSNEFIRPQIAYIFMLWIQFHWPCVVHCAIQCVCIT